MSVYQDGISAMWIFLYGSHGYVTSLGSHCRWTLQDTTGTGVYVHAFSLSLHRSQLVTEARDPIKTASWFSVCLYSILHTKFNIPVIY